MRATIKAKLAGTFTLVIALLCLVVGVGMTRAGALNDMILQVIDGPARRIQLSLTADADVGRAIRAEKNMMLTTDAAEMRELEAKFDGLDGKIRSSLNEGLKIATEQGRPVWTKSLEE